MRISHNNNKGVLDLPISDRPREKLAAKGPENLTDTELLAILLRTGTPKENVLSMAQKFTKLFPLQKLPEVTHNDLVQIQGLGKVKAIELSAVIELGRRIFGKENLTQTFITTSQDALAQVSGLSGKKQEYLIVLYLNARHELLQKETVGIGSLNAAIIEPKEILHHALIKPCAEMIILHNHPSGSPDPSDADIQFTKRLQEAGKIMGINLLDHLIVTKTGYFSFADNKIY